MSAIGPTRKRQWCAVGPVIGANRTFRFCISVSSCARALEGALVRVTIRPYGLKTCPRGLVTLIRNVVRASPGRRDDPRGR
jgi:hypothetical protein